MPATAHAATSAGGGAVPRGRVQETERSAQHPGSQREDPERRGGENDCKGVRSRGMVKVTQEPVGGTGKRGGKPTGWELVCGQATALPGDEPPGRGQDGADGPRAARRAAPRASRTPTRSSARNTKDVELIEAPEREVSRLRRFWGRTLPDVYTGRHAVSPRARSRRESHVMKAESLGHQQYTNGAEKTQTNVPREWRCGH